MSSTPTTSLERIADALERIADALGAIEAQERPQELKNAFTLTSPPLAWFAAQEGPFIGQESHQPDPCAECWDYPGCDQVRASCHAEQFRPAPTQRDIDADQLAQQLEARIGATSQTTWEWLGITPPARRRRAKAPQNAANVATLDGTQSIESKPQVRARAKAPGRTPGTISRCGRCRREGTRRMNHSDRCRECHHEEWWDE